MDRKFIKLRKDGHVDILRSGILAFIVFLIISVVIITVMIDRNGDFHDARSTGSKFSFSRYDIDTNYGGNGQPGWARAGDMDGDGDMDIVAGGGRALYIYENDADLNGWKRYGNLDSTGQIGANGAVLYDIDKDGDLDIVSAKFEMDLGWWENPGGKLSNTQWKFYAISNENWFLHDLIRVKINKDGDADKFLANLNKGYWNAEIKIKWLQPKSDPRQLWEAHIIEPGRKEDKLHSHAGLDAGDVDRDGDVDIAFSNGWYEAPDHMHNPWIWHKVADIYGISNTLLRDMNNDGYLDLVMSAGHHGKGVYWFAAPKEPKVQPWKKYKIDGKILHPEGLAVLDLTGDGALDLITCDLDFDHWDQQVHNVYVFENEKKSQRWTKYNIAPNSYPSHQLQLSDVNRDGKMDIISESAGYKIVSYYENISNVPSSMIP